MKKFFLFAAVAGMLASCSSESLTGSDPNIEPTQEERVPIQLSVASPSVRATTRGTGTVGGVGDGENKWYGQRIKAFMFEKGSLTPALEDVNNPTSYFYRDLELITPGTEENLIPGQSTATNIGEAMLADGKIKYYPHYGNFDFFGYHGDDAITGELNITDNLWTVPFTINGSQDLMSTKAAPQAWTALTTDQQAKFANEAAYNAFINGTGTLEGDFYSAKAARKLIQPVLSFNHLLSRLSFVIKAGNDEAGGWAVPGASTFTAEEAAKYNATLEGALKAGVALTAAQATAYSTAMNPLTKNEGDILTADEANAYNATLTGHKAADDAVMQDPRKAVYVKSIEVKSKTTGDMAVAWKAAPTNIITWGDATAWLPLKERPAYYEKTTPANTISQAVFNSLPAADYYLQADPTVMIDQTAYDLLDAGQQALYAKGQNGYSAVGPDVANNQLTDLTPTCPNMTATGNYPETPIGEALIVAPKAADNYEMKVTVAQRVPTNWADPTALSEKKQLCELVIPAPGDDPATEDVNEGEFEANTSYKVILTVYGFERIQVTTKIIPWEVGADIPVGQD